MLLPRDVWSRVLVFVGSALLLSCAKQAPAPTNDGAVASIPAPLAVAPSWSPTATMASPRAQHAAVLLGSGKLLIINGVSSSGFISSAELYDPATDRWTAAGAPGIQGNVTLAVLLPSGKVLVLTDGSRTGRLYDPVTGTWTATGALSDDRAMPSVTLLESGQVLVAGGTAGGGVRLTSADLYDPVANTFTPTGGMTLGRGAHSATRLKDGRVLAVSGFNQAGEVPGADLYDPATGTWSAAAPPLVARHYFTSTLLPDGRVLIAGGFGASGVLSDAELYDPASNSWTATGRLAFARSGHAATLLPDGRVLVTGGALFRQAPEQVSEIYDPVTGLWSPGGTMLVGRENHTATLLPSGKVLAAGGYNGAGSLVFFASTELYDPGVNGWTPAGSLGSAQVDPLVALLPSGRVLVAGGRDEGGVSLASARLYERTSNDWTSAPALSIARERATATLLRSGTVLVVGGLSRGNAVGSTERYDEAANAWSPTAALASARYLHTATLLRDGRVLVVGGQSGATVVLGTAELYDPATDAWTPAASLATARSAHAAALLPDGRVLVAGGRDGTGTALATAEVYDPTTNTWAPAARLAEGRQGLTLTPLPSGQVLAVGGLSGAGGLTSTELYDAGTNTWAAGPALSEAHGFHTATLAPSGKVLVAGGSNAPGTFATSADVYDPALHDWTSVSAPSNFGGLVAVALPSGEVLLAGGSTAELYEDTGAQSDWRPVVNQPDVLVLACPSVIQGLRFRGISGASGGSFGDSPTDFPLVRLRGAEGGRLWTLPATGMSATSATVTVPADVPLGTYALSVFANAIPGGRMVTVAPNAVPTAQSQTVSTSTDAPVAITLVGTDPDMGQTLSWTLVTSPRHGTLSGTPPSLTYTPEPGYEGPDSFTFQVRDCGQDSNVATVDIDVANVPPVITCPADTVSEAVGPDGAPGNWPPATATDSPSDNPTITYSPPRESTFPLGSTTVTATATDDSGGTASCSFQYTVQDTTAPSVTCPADIQVRSDDASGTTVTYTLPESTDAVSSPTVTASPASGSVFRHGATRVTVTATDAAGNSAQCSFQVSVQAVVVSIAGGGCQSTGSGMVSSLALLLGLAWWSGPRRRRSPRPQARSRALVVLLVALLSPAVQAQSAGPILPMDLERLRFSPAATDSLLVDTGHVLPEGSYRLLLMAGYERGILLLRGSDGVERSIIDYRVAGWLAGAWSPVERLELSARLPIIIAQGGSGAESLVGVTAPTSFGLGTPELGARYALLRREDGAPVFLGLGLDLGLPGGTASAFGRQNGWAGFQFAPRVAVGREVGPVSLGASAGVRIRSTEVEPGRNFGSELEQGLVVATRGTGLRAEIALEAAESLVAPDVALELLGGLRLPVGQGFEAFALAGHGFTDIPGTPSFRVAAGIAWAPQASPARAREDVCQEGRSHTPEQCPEQDDDGDSVANAQDRCPLEAGSVDNGGCPDGDSDGDGVVDRLDRCASEPGLSRYQGCPAPDADGDGIADDEDACPQEAGVRANRGCPAQEEKPTEAPPAEPPREQTPPPEQTSLPTDHHVLFPVGESSLQEEEKRQLDAIADYLKAHPELSVRVEGHTDSTGPEELNVTLSQQRADMVREYLIQRGIAGSRLTAKGYGSSRPVADNSTPEGQRANRRVEFVTEKR